MATISVSESPLALLDQATSCASNDEALEMATRLIEHLGERAETSADIVLNVVDDRDLENEALVFMDAVDGLVSVFATNARVKRVWHRVHDAQEDVKVAASNRRARLEGGWRPLQPFSHRRRQRVQRTDDAQRRLAEIKSDKLVKRANVTPERVLDALRKAVEANPGGVCAKDVAVALLPELTSTKVPGRQRVICRIAMELRKLAADGEAEKHRPDDLGHGRRTYLYSLRTSEEGGGDA